MKKICRLDDILPNTGVCALVDGRQVAVFRLDDDSVYAFDAATGALEWTVPTGGYASVASPVAASKA